MRVLGSVMGEKEFCVRDGEIRQLEALWLKLKGAKQEEGTGGVEWSYVRI